MPGNNLSSGNYGHRKKSSVGFWLIVKRVEHYYGILKWIVGGPLCAWNPKKIDCYSFLCSVGICLECKFVDW